MGFNVRTNLFLIILLFSSFFVAAEDTECCIYHAGGNRFYCTEDVGNSAFSPGGVCTSYIEDIENSYVGKIASPCNEVPECNFVCLQTLDLNQLLTYNMTYIYDQDTVDSFVYINSIDSDFDEAVSTIDSDTFKSTVGCSDQIPLCNEDASLEAKRCNSTTDFDNDKCLCVFSGGSRTILSSSTDLYCGKFEVEEGYDKCQDSFVEARLYDYNFTFTITFEDENDILLPLQDIDVIVQNIQFDNGGSTSEQFTGITDSSGESIVTVSVNSIIDSVHISISGDGYEEIYEFVDLTFEFEGYEKAISRTLMIDNGCDDGDINYYPITDDCVYIQECEEISGSWMWGSIKEDPDNECEIQKDRCDDNVLDINLGEECVPGGPDVCGGGRFCNNDCYCENLVEGVCSNNGTLEDWEFCDKNYLNSLPDSEKWKAFNIPKDSYVAGMDCALDCTIIPVRTCGNGEYEPGETCEFIFNEDDTIYQHSLLNDPQLRCELVSDCREIGSIGECTCKIEVNCGDDIIQGAEECDGTSDFSCGGRGCGDDCRCIMPTCPLESDLLFNNATFDSDKLSLKFNVTNCSEDPIQKLNIVYYKSESEGGDDSIVIETKKFIELDITNSNLFGENINLDFTLEPLTLDVFTTSNLLLSNPDSEIILEDNSRYCFYLEAEYDQNPSFIFPQTLRSEPIKCVDIGDPICGGDTEGSYCYRNDIYYCDGREPSECADDEICRADGNTAECVNITNHDACTYECGDTFGMF
ncbi:hypothetical protein C0585_00115 [Candidatus Woesearchaeota archaeon]|nr:MAG: hypothetical protein C0585_00115 [Candidatus Woesearchaeota archaeon]